MKVLVVLALATLAHATSNDLEEQPISAHGFITEHSIPLAKRIRAAEESLLIGTNRITGGSQAPLGHIPYQAGVLTSFIGESDSGVCGGSLVKPNRVIYAAHCWYDGVSQGRQSIVVLGSIKLFSGGTRLTSNKVVLHPQWNTVTLRNDVAVIYLPQSVTYTNNIKPIALPSGSQLTESFVEETAIASGFGRTGDNAAGDITISQTLSYVAVPVITNAQCRLSYANEAASNICVSGAGARSTCQGDSGGPLAVTRNGQPLLIGVSSAVYGGGCQKGLPAVFSRVTSFMSFFNQHL